MATPQGPPAVAAIDCSVRAASPWTHAWRQGCVSVFPSCSPPLIALTTRSGVRYARKAVSLVWLLNMISWRRGEEGIQQDRYTYGEGRGEARSGGRSGAPGASAADLEEPLVRLGIRWEAEKDHHISGTFTLLELTRVVAHTCAMGPPKVGPRKVASRAALSGLNTRILYESSGGAGRGRGLSR
jgi:hypothetical protein